MTGQQALQELSQYLDRKLDGRPSGALARSNKVWYFRQTGLFDRLSETDLQRLAGLSQVRKYSRGQVILGSAPACNRVYMVAAGQVKLATFSAVGKEQILALLGPGSVFGDFALGDVPLPAHAEALDNAMVCTVDRTLFEDIVGRTPEVALRVIHALARRLRAAEQEIEDLAFRNVPGRLAALLLRLAEEYGEPHGLGVRLSLRLSHQDLANMIGATRETVTAILNRFRNDGLITVEQHILVILDHEQLKVIVQHGRHKAWRPARGLSGLRVHTAGESRASHRDGVPGAGGFRRRVLRVVHPAPASAGASRSPVTAKIRDPQVPPDLRNSTHPGGVASDRLVGDSGIWISGGRS